MTPAALDDLCRRLPLPLAQQLHDALNAGPYPEQQHSKAFYLWEAALRLAGCVALVDYLARGGPNLKLDGDLREHLKRPALGHWWGFLRGLLPVLAGAGDVGYQKLRDFILGPPCHSPGAAKLHAALTQVLQAKDDDEALRTALQEPSRGRGESVKVGSLFDLLVQYRNEVVGHSNFAGRPQWFHQLMAPLMLDGVAEVLSKWDVLVGRRLVYVGEVKGKSGGFEVSRYALHGLASSLQPPLTVAQAEAERLPRSKCIYLEAEGLKPAAAPGRLLHPLLLWDRDGGAVLFFRSRPRKEGELQYDNILRGTPATRTDLGAEPRTLLAQVLGLPEEPGPPEGRSPPTPPRRHRRWLVLLAVAFLAAGGLVAAVRFWPTSAPPCTVAQGKGLVDQGRYKEAIKCFDDVIAREPSASLQEAFPYRAAACAKSGNAKPQDALAAYKTGLALENKPEPEYAKAIQAYKNAYDLDPALFWAANNLAYLLALCPDARMRSPEEAAGYAEKACEGSGWKCWYALDTLAVVRASQGQFDKAVDLTRTALRLAPTADAEKAQLGLKLERYQRKQGWEPNRADPG
jgi:tetratricopeptide (TPR) repeat protein